MQTKEMHYLGIGSDLSICIILRKAIDDMFGSVETVLGILKDVNT
jgi:hypothetical protein